MVAYNFQARFAEAVAAGEKRQTIRAPRARHVRVGEPVQLYTGMRTRLCRKLVVPDPVCTTLWPIWIGQKTVAITRDQRLIEAECYDDPDGLARADGFAEWREMRDWFAETHGLPFGGVLIRWAPA